MRPAPECCGGQEAGADGDGHSEQAVKEGAVESEVVEQELETLALQYQIPLRKGVFVAVAGPNLETRAEYRFLRWIGADVVGMSLIPENIVAVHGGMKVAAISVITDMGLPDALEPVDIARIVAVAEQASPKLSKLVAGLIESLRGESDD